MGLQKDVSKMRYLSNNMHAMRLVASRLYRYIKQRQMYKHVVKHGNSFGK